MESEPVGMCPDCRQFGATFDFWSRCIEHVGCGYKRFKFQNSLEIMERLFAKTT